MAAVLAHVTTFTIAGLDPRQVTVEVDLRAGLPNFTIVGLGDRAVREARERVHAAILNSGFEFPARRLTVNLAPAYLRKAGPGFDLAIAVGVLAASGQIPAAALERLAVFGELSLGGELRPSRGALAVAEGDRARRARQRSSSRASGPPRPRSSSGLDGRRRADPRRGRRRPARRRPPAAARAGDDRAPGRPDRSPTSPTSAATPTSIGALDDRRRRRSQHAAVRAARRGQDDARPAPAVDPARR